MKKGFAVLFIMVFVLMTDAFCVLGQDNHIKTAIFRMGAFPNVGDEVIMSRYDKIVLNKFHYDDINGDTWQAIKSLNPGSEIYLYQQVTHVNVPSDSQQAVSLNNLGRYNISRGHSMGSLNLDNPGFFLLNEWGNRVYYRNAQDRYLLDFGNDDFRDYSAEAIISDNVGQPWTADGVFSDLTPSIMNGYYTTPVLYNTNTLWSEAMNGMLSSMTDTLNSEGLRFMTNRGQTRRSDGYDAWIELDGMGSPPDGALEEGAFAVSWGADTWFFSEAEFKRQVDILQNINNSDVIFISHTTLNPGETGTDNYGNHVSYWQTLWYSLSSFLLGNKDNSYFFFGVHPYSRLEWFDEYDIDMGAPVTSYNIDIYNGHNIYWREFEKGYVYVNPTRYDVNSVHLPVASKPLNHSNIIFDPAIISDVDYIDIKGNHGMILLKSATLPVCGDGNCDAGENCSSCAYDCGTCQGGLISHWRFDEGSGTTAADSSGNNNDGAISGAAWTNESRVGNLALHFDGVDDYMEADNSDSLNSEYITAMLWFRPDSLTDNAGLLAKGDNSHRQYWVWIYQGNLSLEIGEGGYHNNIYPLQQDAWHHLAFTYNGSSVITYINGTEVSSVPQATGPILAGDYSLFIGKLPGYVSFNGTIDDIRIYNHTMNSTEILELYNSTFHRADNNPRDGCVEEHELITAIDDWKYDSTTNPMGEVMEAVSLWSYGTGCP